MSESNFTHYVVAEYQILREMFHDPLLTQSYQRDIFSHKEALATYDAIRQLHETAGSVTEADVLRVANKINEKVTYETIHSIVTMEKSVESIDALIKFSWDSAVFLQVKDRFAFLMGEILEKKIDSAMLSAELGLLQKLTMDLNSGKIKFRTISEWLDLYKIDLEIRRIGNYQLFNDTFLDNYLTRKAEPGQIILIAGATGNGKSAYALNLINSMINCEQPVIYFSLEMDIISTLDRLLSIRTEIPINDWYTQGDAVDGLLVEVAKEEQALIGKPFLFVDNPSITLVDIQVTVQKFKAIHKISRCVIFIDLVTQVQEFVQLSKTKTMATAIELACNQLNEIAKSENICVVALAQIGRNADSMKLVKQEDLEKLRPSLNDIKNSNALAERSRVVISIFRPKYYADRYLSHLEDVAYMNDYIDAQVLKQTQGNITKPHSYLFKAECMKILPIIDVDGDGINF